MGMDLYEAVERIVAAQERTAAALESILGKMSSGCKCGSGEPTCDPDEPTVGDGAIEIKIEQPEHPSEKAMADAAYLEREFVKKMLTEKGIKFKASATTNALKKLLETSAPLVEETPAPVETPAAAVSKDEVRAALVSCSAREGKEKALNILKTIGKAEKLSDVSPDLYPALLEACNG